MLEQYFRDDFLTGTNLVGDNFNQNEIEQWYNEEKEAYCGLINSFMDETYLYENINNFYGLKKILDKLKNAKNLNILCFGAGYGGEVKAIKKILDKNSSLVYNITVIDSSDILIKSIKKELDVYTVKATIDGTINLDINSFDLITCFGVLHHIPNVSYVLSEFTKILKPKGFIFLREPISSMGNWSNKRIGTTINERGITSDFFIKIFKKLQCSIVSKHYCFFSPILKVLNKLNLGLDSHIVIYIDFILSKLFSWNIHYYRNTVLKKMSPGSVFILCQKQ